jgi:hypothetical protein
MVCLTTLSVRPTRLIQLRMRTWLMNNKLESLWKEMVVTQFKVLSRHLFGGTEVNHENHQSRLLVSGLRI